MPPRHHGDEQRNGSRQCGFTEVSRKIVDAQRPSGVAPVGAGDGARSDRLLPCLTDFQARFPDIEVRVSTTSRKLRYIGDAFDIGVRSGPEQGTGVVSRTLMADLRLPACSLALLRKRPIQDVTDLRHQTLLHSASTRTAWANWLREAGMPDLRAARHAEFDHVHLQLAAAVEGLGVTLASLPLIGRDIAAGRLVCPIAAPTWRAADYTLVINADRAGDNAVMAFEQWITVMAGQETMPFVPVT